MNIPTRQSTKRLKLSFKVKELTEPVIHEVIQNSLINPHGTPTAFSDDTNKQIAIAGFKNAVYSKACLYGRLFAEFVRKRLETIKDSDFVYKCENVAEFDLRNPTASLDASKTISAAFSSADVINHEGLVNYIELLYQEFRHGSSTTSARFER